MSVGRLEDLIRAASRNRVVSYSLKQYYELVRFYRLACVPGALLAANKLGLKKHQPWHHPPEVVRAVSTKYTHTQGIIRIAHMLEVGLWHGVYALSCVRFLCMPMPTHSLALGDACSARRGAGPPLHA